LVAAAETLTGTAFNDTFNAADTTLTVADSINGGAGIDTINFVNSAAAIAFPAAAISNVEIFNLRNVNAGALTFDASQFVGTTAVNNDRATGAVTVTGLAAGAAIGVIGNGVVTNSTTSYAYAAPAGAQTINISGGTLGGNITATASAAVTTATINSTGVANTVGTVLLASAAANTVTGLTVNAASNLTAALTPADFSAAAALTVSGAAASVTLTAPGNFKTIDASGLTAGGLTIALGTNLTSFKGGLGNDVVTTAAVTTTTASAVDAGAGTADRLVIGAATDVNTAAKAKVYANFEVLQTAGNNVDLALFTNSAITSVRTSGTATIDNATATQAGAVTVTANSTTTLNVVGAATVGQIDTVKITVDDGATAVGAVGAITLTAPALAGVEILNLVATDGFTIDVLTASTALTNVNVTGAGNTSITTGALALNVNSVIDASAATGTTVINATAATANGISIKGSLTKAGTLTGTALADTIVGGAANDTITGGAGNNVMTGGGGADSFVVVATGALPSATSFQTITDFSKVAGTTTFDTISAAALILGVQTAVAAAGVATITGGLATFNAADTTFAQHLAAVAAAQQATAGATTVWQEGADTYMFISDGTLAVAAADTLIKLVGVTAGAITVAGNAVTAMA